MLYLDKLFFFPMIFIKNAMIFSHFKQSLSKFSIMIFKVYSVGVILQFNYLDSNHIASWVYLIIHY